ncbi:MAG: hypothetical protein KBG01_01870, partial [Syntrophobacterales bacterium]|nr:hypothetical protein [Syntrophobacterales bacterium]
MKDVNARFTLKTKVLILLGIVVVVSLCMAGYTVMTVRNNIITTAHDKLKSVAAMTLAILN